MTTLRLLCSQENEYAKSSTSFRFLFRVPSCVQAVLYHNFKSLHYGSNIFFRFEFFSRDGASGLPASNREVAFRSGVLLLLNLSVLHVSLSVSQHDTLLNKISRTRELPNI